MYVVLLSAIGPVGLAVTTNLNINFLRKGTLAVHRLLYVAYVLPAKCLISC
jgi:hypothetical protein